MIIKREFGKTTFEFELSEEELKNAFLEQQHLNDVFDIISEINRYKIDKTGLISFEEDYGCPFEAIDDDEINKIAYEKRRLINESYMPDNTVIIEAIQNILKQKNNTNKNTTNERMENE